MGGAGSPGHGAGLWQHLGLFLALSLPHSCPGASPALPLGDPVFLDGEVLDPSCEGQCSPDISWEWTVVVRVCLGRVVLARFLLLC